MVACLRTQLLESLALPVGHAIGRSRRRWRLRRATRFMGVMRVTIEDPCFMRRPTCSSSSARPWSLRSISVLTGRALTITL
jgi:hypothetical protein